MFQEGGDEGAGSSRCIENKWSEGDSFHFSDSRFILVTLGLFVSVVAGCNGGCSVGWCIRVKMFTSKKVFSP